MFHPWALLVFPNSSFSPKNEYPYVLFSCMASSNMLKLEKERWKFKLS